MHPFFSLGRTVLLDSWCAMVVLGLSAGSVVAMLTLRKDLGWSRALLLSAVMVLSALFGAHLGHCLLHPSACPGGPLEGFLLLGRSGHSIGGALALSVLVLGLLSRILPGVSFLAAADAFALGTPLGLFFARIGCHLKGCCWGVPLPEGHFLEGLSTRLVDSRLVSLHPVQLYSAAAALLLFSALLATRKRWSRPGLTASLFALAYGLGRFLLEFLRADSDGRRIFGGLWVHQAWSLAMAACGLAFLLLLAAWTRPGSPEPPAPSN